MKKAFAAILVALCIALTAGIFVACDNGPANEGSVKYTVTFYDENGSTVLSTEEVDSGSELTVPASPQKTGYTFTGWLLAGADGTYGTEIYSFDAQGAKTVRGDMSFKALYTVNTYTVTFVFESGRQTETQEVGYGSAFALPAAGQCAELVLYIRTGADADGNAQYSDTAYDISAEGAATVTADTEFYVREIAAHTFGNPVPEVPASCTEPGTREYYECSVCHNLFVKEGSEYVQKTQEELVLPLIAHDYGEEIAEDPATCTEPGTKAHYQCSACKGLFVKDGDLYTPVTEEALVIPAAHTYGDEIAEVPATCTATGVAAHYECSVCHNLFVKEGNEYVQKTQEELVLPLIAHDYGEEIAEDPATCTEPGTKAHYQCSVCLKFFIAEDGAYTEVEEADLIIEAKGHTPATQAALQGNVWYANSSVCSVCGEILQLGTAVVPAAGGSEQIVAVKWSEDDFGKALEMTNSLTTWNVTITEYILSAAPSGWPSEWEWQPSYMWMSSGYGYLVLPAMNYAGLQEVSFRIGNIAVPEANVRTILYGPSATNYGNTAVTGLTTGQFDLGASSAALFTIKDGALYKDGSKLYDLEGAVVNGTLPLAFAVKGMGSVALYVSDFTVSCAAPQAGTVIEASRYNTTVSTASGMYAGSANVGNVIYYEGNQETELRFENGYYAHTRVSGVYEYYITFAAVNYSLYEQFGAVTFRLQGGQYQSRNYSVYCGETLLLSTGSKDAASVFHIKGGKLYADLAYKIDVPADVYNGLAPLVLKIVFDSGDTNMGISISDVTTAEKVETAVSVYQDAVVRVSDKDISMNGGDRTDMTYEPDASIAFSGMGISGYSEGTLILPAVRAIEGSMTFYFGISGTAEGYVFETGGVTIYEYGPNDLGKAIKITVNADGSVLVNDESAAPAGTVSAEVIAGTAGFEMKLSTAGDIADLYPNARISQYAYYAL